MSYKVRFFDPAKIYQEHKEEFDEKIQDILSRGDLILRSDVEEFEKSLAEFVGTKYAVALNSGTDALYLALRALGANKDSRIAVPSHTFVATAQVVSQIGAKPILFDLGEQPNDDMDIYMVSHIAGSLSEKPVTEKPIIEDACQALGALKNPTSAAQCWSFYPAKTLGAFGDAGALTTNDVDIYEYVIEARNHFKTNYEDWGINSRLDNIQAGVLNVRFKYLPLYLKRRQEIADMYNAGLSLLPIKLPEKQIGRTYQDYIVEIDERDELYEYLKKEGVETMKNEYPFPIEKLPKSLTYEHRTLRLPCNPVLTDLEASIIIEKIKTFYDTRTQIEDKPSTERQEEAHAI